MKSSTIEVSGQRIALYERHGHGAALFFIHGNSSNAHAFEDVFRSDALEPFRLIAIDLPGHGRSAASEDPARYAFPSLGRMIADIIKVKELRHVILVGHSLGGHVAMSALNFTDRVKGVLLTGTMPVSSADDIPLAYRISDVVQTVFKGDVTEYDIVRFAENAVFDKEKVGFVVESFKETDKRFRERMNQELSTYFLSQDFKSEVELLKNKNVSVCFVNGAEERVVDLAYLRVLKARGLSKAKVVSVQGAGHCVPLESPGEFSQTLREFVLDMSAASV